MSGRYSVAVLDMAGTTVVDGGTVMTAFAEAMRAVGLEPGTGRWDDAVRIVTDTMGQSKIEVFTRILGDPALAQAANAGFETAYDAAVARGEVAAVPGAADTIDALRRDGVKVCLTTGFAPRTREGILDALQWHDLVDLALSPADAGRGRPWPDMVWTGAMRLGADSARSVVVAGDTPSDISTGRAAGAGLVVGVLTGAGSGDQLRDAGADHVIDDITALPELLG